MSKGYATCLVILVLWSILSISQLWFNILSTDIFIKISITCFVIFILCFIVTLALKEYKSEKDMKDKDFID